MPYIFSTECTESLVVECAADIEMTVRNCAAAFETEGANIIADIKCAKDLLADKKHCWPCICAEAKIRGWHIIGCWMIFLFINLNNLFIFKIFFNIKFFLLAFSLF